MKKRYAQPVCNKLTCTSALLCQSLILTLASLALPYVGYAQVAVTYPQQAEDIVACNRPGDLRVRVRFVSSGADEPVVTINLPPGLEYEPGSLTINDGNLAIVEGDLSDPGAPQFLVTPADISADDVVDFSITRSGGCEARAFAVDGGLFKDTVSIQTVLGAFTEDNPNLNTYNLLFASLSHQYPNGPGSQDTIISDVPQVISRPVRMTQGGLGFVDSVTYYVVLGDVQAYELLFGGSPLVPAEISGDTLFYGLSELAQPGIFGGDNRFSNGEQVDFQEQFEVQTCTQALNLVEHHAFWGCGANLCQQTVPAVGSVAVIVPQPTVETGELFDRSLPACLDGATPAQFGFFIENTGTTTALVGFQLGFDGNTSLPDFGDYGANNASIDTASIRLELDGADISRAPDEVHDGVNFCSGGLPDGSVSAARYFNFTLLPGERLEITGNYVYCCRESCNDSYSWSTPIARFQVRDACGNIPRLEVVSHDFADARLSATPTIISGPATIFDGDQVNYCFEYPSLDGYPDVNGDNAYTVELGLPDDFDLQLTGNIQVTDRNGDPIPFDLIGLGTARPSVRIQQSDYGEGAVEFCFELAWNCGGAGLVEMPVALYQTVGAACTDACYLGISCSRFPVLLFCPGGGCSGGGGAITSSTAQRVNLGYADTENNRIWETNAVANPDQVRLDRAAPCDTIVTQASLSVLPGATASWAQGRFRQSALFPFFRPLGAKAEIYDNGALIGTVDNIPATNVQGDTVFDYHVSAAVLHELNPGFPEDFVFSVGDSVSIEAQYYFDPHLAEGGFYDFNVDGFTPNTTFCVENQDIRNWFQLSNDGFQTVNSCGFTIDRVQLISAAVSFASGGEGRFSGCEELIWEVFTRTQRGCVTGADIDFFPNEFRPVFAFDTLALAKIPGYTFKRLEYRRSPEVFTIDLLPFAEDADSLYFDVRNFYSDRGGPIPLWEEQARDEILKSFWQPSCASQAGEVYGNARVQYEDPSCGGVYSRAQERLLNYVPIGQFSFVVNPLVNNAFTEENCFTLSAANTGVGSGFDVPYTWLEIIDEDGLVVVERVRENGGAPLNLTASGIYELGQHPNNTTEQIEICVSQTSCLPDSFLIVYGWNCEGYPGTDNPIGSCFLDTLVAYINPQLAEVQLQITDQPSPSESLELCATDTIEVLVNSAQQADLINPVLDVILPPGVEVNSMQAGYPNNANIVFEPLPGLVNGDTVTFDLTAHSQILGDSLPGTFSNAGIANRQMRVVFEIETGCGFDPSKTVAFYRARGLSPCSDPAIGSDILVASNPINVAGTDAPYETMPEVSVDGALEGCGSTVRVHAAFTLMGAGTTGRDTAALVVPPGIGYVPGSLICESPNAGSCPSFTGAGINAEGAMELGFALPPNLPDGTAIAFSFEIVEEDAVCAVPAVGVFRTVVTRDPLVCNGLPCLTELDVVTGQDTVAVFVKKPEYTFSNISGCLNEDGTFQLQADVVLGGVGQADGGAVSVNVFCTDASGQPDGMPLDSIVFSGPLAPDSVLPVGLSGTFCPGTTGLWLEAIADCACDTTVQLISLENPVSLTCPEDFSVCLNAAPVVLEGASPAGGTYEGPGVVAGVFDPALSGVGAHTLVYTYSGDLGCQSSCSFEMVVAAAPVVICPDDQEVALGSGPFVLTGGVPSGGHYAGPGVSNGLFDPEVAGSGAHVLTYTYSGPGGCTESCTFLVTVTSALTEVGDFVWLDTNQDGLQDPGEPGLQGVKVALEREEGGGFYPVDSMTTDGSGYYRFETEPGVYRIRFYPANGLSFTMPLQGTDFGRDSDAANGGYTAVFALTAGEADLSIDAGYFSLCDNVTAPGQIGPDQYVCAPGNTPAPIESLTAPSGGSGALEYLWMRSTVAGPFNLQTWEMIPNSNTSGYMPGPLSETTYFARCARRENCTVYLESNIVTVEVGNEAVAEINGPEVLCVGEPGTFTAVDAGPGALYEWAMGLGLSPASASGTEVTVSAPYSHGRFPVTLSVTQNGCTAVTTQRITATQSPFYCGTPLPLSASPVEVQGVSCVKINWMLKELEAGYTYTVRYAGPGEDEFRPIAQYDKPVSFIGDQHFYEHLHDNPGKGVHRYQVMVSTREGHLLYSEYAMVALLEEVTLFPNPARHLVTVALADPFGPGDRLELFNAFGQVIQTVVVESGDTQIDLNISSLPAGTYFVRLWRGQTRWEVLPFVKE